LSAVAGRPTARPPADNLFAPVQDRYGQRLALVFGSHAPDGICAYFRAGRCHHCDIGAGEGAQFDRATNRARLAWFREHYASVLEETVHLVLYNSGSVLNPREIPPDLLGEILAWARDLPALAVVSIESREAYITEPTIAEVAAALPGPLRFHPILGLETADDRLRNDLLQKKMPRSAVTRAFDSVGAVARALGPGRVGLDVNVVVAGPGTAAENAVEEAAATARFAFEQARRASLEIDLNLHPYYPSERGRTRFPDQPRCSLDVLARAVAAIHREKEALAPEAGIFIGAQDEGHDTEKAERAGELERAAASFVQYNRTQDPGALTDLLAEQT